MELNSVRVKKDDIEDIINFFCIIKDVSVFDLCSKNRHMRLVDLRYMLIDLIYHNPNFHMSLYRMAAIVGKKDHTTIIHALKTTKILVEIYPKFELELKDIHQKIYGDLRYYIHSK